MNLIDFLYRLLERFVPIPEAKLMQIENEAKAWHMKQLDPNNENKLSKLYAKYSEEWYVKTALAVLYLFALKAVSQWIAGKDNNDD